jgi:hypothetical protein
MRHGPIIVILGVGVLVLWIVYAYPRSQVAGAQED